MGVIEILVVGVRSLLASERLSDESGSEMGVDRVGVESSLLSERLLLDAGESEMGVTGWVGVEALLRLPEASGKIETDLSLAGDKWEMVLRVKEEEEGGGEEWAQDKASSSLSISITIASFGGGRFFTFSVFFLFFTSALSWLLSAAFRLLRSTDRFDSSPEKKCQ